MSCNGLSPEELVAWLDGECAAAEAARVQSHVAACAECRREAELLRGSAALLARLPGLAAPAGFETRVVAAARAVPASSGRMFRLRPRVAAAAAAIVAVAAGVWWIAADRGASSASVLTSREEEALADDLVVISSLDVLQAADEKELAQVADDLDVIDSLGTDGEGG